MIATLATQKQSETVREAKKKFKTKKGEGYRIVCLRCDYVSTYRNEGAYIDDIPDSIPYCHGCGKPITGDEISRC